MRERLYREQAWRLTSGVIVEVGVAYGKGLTYLGERAHYSVRLIGVDVWTELQGFDNLPEEVLARLRKYQSPIDACRGEMGEYAARVMLRQGTSVEQAKHVPNAWVDFCFIDDDHSYEGVKASIEAWRPKIKPGGCLAGHDYNDHYPGVARAVGELLPLAEVRRNDPDEWGNVWVLQC